MDTAEAVGSGDLPVLGTPRLLAWAAFVGGSIDLPGDVYRAGFDALLDTVLWRRCAAAVRNTSCSAPALQRYSMRSEGSRARTTSSPLCAVITS